MAPATLENWMIVSRRHRRLLFASMFCLMLGQGMLFSSQRSFFEKWAASPPPPASFFARTNPATPQVRFGVGRGGSRFVFHALAAASPRPRSSDDWVSPDFVVPPASEPGVSSLQLPGNELSLARFSPAPDGLGNPAPAPAPAAAPLAASPARTAAAVPESSTWIMMLIGFAVIGQSLRARRRKAEPPALNQA